jgi:hypothetical protein
MSFQSLMLPYDLDTAVLIVLNIIGWGVFACVLWQNRCATRKLETRTVSFRKWQD